MDRPTQHQTPRLTDRDRLAANRARASAGGFESFLHDRVAADLQERLAMVNRAFTAPAIVTGRPEGWADFLPGARVVPDSATLDLAPGAHDLVLHVLALHWADDPVGQLVQCRRALRPDGLLLAAAPGGRTLAAFRAVLLRAETEIRGGAAPRIAPMGEVRSLGALLQRAGFALPVADSTALRLSYPDIRAVLRDLRAMGEGNALARRDGRPLPRTVLERAETLWRDHFPDSAGRLAETVEIVTLTGWAPAPGQPQPLRPGSATASLADHLGGPAAGPGD